MPRQTTLTGKVYYGDGVRVSVKESGAGSYTDIGALGSDVNLTLNFDKNEYETANAGKLAPQMKNMTMAGAFTLIQLDPDNINRLGGGIFEKVTTAGGSVSSIDNQVIASGAASNVTPYNLSIVETGGASLKVASSLVIASVTGATDGALAANDDYTIIDDANSPSGKSIVFNTAGTTLTTMAQVITIAYTSVTPVASTELYGGTTTLVLNAMAIKFTHYTDDAYTTIDREVEIYSADVDGGGFQFNFKSATTDGVEEMPIAFTGKPDVSLTDMRQLFRYYTAA